MNDTDKIDPKSLTSEEAITWMESLGEKPFRAKQIRKWIFERGVSDFSEMTDLSKSFREKLPQVSQVTELEEINRKTSSDGTVKFLYRLADGLSIESVWIPEEKRATLCISTQVGCKLDCGFCMTGQSGFRRNLTTAEIVDQFIQSKKRVPDGKITNIVYMGMGEPLDNYENTLHSLKIFTDDDIKLVGVRKITVSTAGIAPAIERLSKDFPKVTLAVSLNGADDATRLKTMPICKKYPMETLLSSLKKWPLPKGKLISFEYVLIAGVNDSDEQAQKLSRLGRLIPCKINLIPFNECDSLPYKRPSDNRIEKFMKIAMKDGLLVFPRTSRGEDILAACGQLRGLSD